MQRLILTQHPHRTTPHLLQFKQTVPTDQRDYFKWHHGRSTYAVWTIDVGTPDILKRFYRAQSHLGAYLMKPYRRQPHITVFVSGFLKGTKTLDDDYTHHKRFVHLRAIKDARMAPFELEIGGIDSFATAPFLNVLDSGGSLQKIRRILSSTHSEIRMSPYIPHVTLGLYAGSFKNSVLAEKLASFQDTHMIPQRVKEIRLSTYSAQEIAGPLTVCDTIRLQSNPSNL